MKIQRVYNKSVLIPFDPSILYQAILSQSYHHSNQSWLTATSVSTASTQIDSIWGADLISMAPYLSLCSGYRWHEVNGFNGWPNMILVDEIYDWAILYNASWDVLYTLAISYTKIFLLNLMSHGDLFLSTHQRHSLLHHNMRYGLQFHDSKIWYILHLSLSHFTNELVQERHNSSALSMELCLSCPNSSIWTAIYESIIQYTCHHHTICNIVS